MSNVIIGYTVNTLNCLMFTIPAQSGIYTLIIEVARPIRVEVGQKGLKNFKLGFYTYTGSAIGQFISLKTRISRHLQSEKKNYWHIDYLLDEHDVDIRAVICLETHSNRECTIAKSLENLVDTQILVKGFGSSDCQNADTPILETG